MSSPALFARILTLQTKERYNISAEFVLQLIKTISNQYRSCTTGKDGPGGI
ncbi:MAG TPA: hypothetical protein VKA09_11710 [Nitrososphaeraceae archaeon]|nr:hypothetical protein [Nitrososphaeraceae archaeon]